MDNSILQISNKPTNCLGTGFVIDKDDDGVFVATCGHVVNNCKDNILVDGRETKLIKNEFEKNFEKSLESFTGQPKIWIRPRIHTKEEESKNG